MELSRVPKSSLKPEEFYAGKVHYKDIRRIHNTKDPTLIGTGVERERTLTYEEQTELPQLMIDTRITLNNNEFNWLSKNTEKILEAHNG